MKTTPSSREKLHHQQNRDRFEKVYKRKNLLYYRILYINFFFEIIDASEKNFTLLIRLFIKIKNK